MNPDEQDRLLRARAQRLMALTIQLGDLEARYTQLLNDLSILHKQIIQEYEGLDALLDREPD